MNLYASTTPQISPLRGETSIFGMAGLPPFWPARKRGGRRMRPLKGGRRVVGGDVR